VKRFWGKEVKSLVSILSGRRTTQLENKCFVLKGGRRSKGMILLLGKGKTAGDSRIRKKRGTDFLRLSEENPLPRERGQNSTAGTKEKKAETSYS